MKAAITAVAENRNLTRIQAEHAAELILTGRTTEAQTAALLTGLRMKGETVDEILGFATVLRGKANTISPHTGNYLDLVGTGGDSTFTFNISTTSAFVVAAAGVPVAKHGNRSISSKSGAGDVLEALGVNISADPEVVEKCVEHAGIGFMFAPHFNPCMKYVGPVRNQLGIRTVFNILGPLSNPSRAKKMLVGVYSPSLVETIAKVMSGLGVERGLIVSGEDNMDEITLTGETTVGEIKDGRIEVYTITPEQFSLTRCSLEELRGGDGTVNAQITRNILGGKETGAKRDIVLLNAGAALYTGQAAESIEEGIKLAAAAIDSGKALQTLEAMVRFSN